MILRYPGQEGGQAITIHLHLSGDDSSRRRTPKRERRAEHPADEAPHEGVNLFADKEDTMRTKEQYVEGLRKMRRNLYYNGTLIDRDDELQR